MAAPMRMAESWWVYAVEGVVAILFGLAALFWPALTLTVLIALFAAYALVSGIAQFIALFRAIGAHTAWWPHLLIGIVSIAAGIVVLVDPFITAVLLLYVIAVWAIIDGIIEILASLAIANLLLLVVGVISVVFGFILLANPLAGALALVIVIGVFAIIRGIVLLIHAFSAPTTFAASH